MQRTAQWISLACLLAGTAVGHAGDAGSGLTPSRDSHQWTGLQGRVSLNTGVSLPSNGWSGLDSARLKVQGVGLFGDYYFTRTQVGQKVAGGFRATSGMLVGASSSLWATSALGQSGFSSITRRNIGMIGAALASETESSTQSYLGLGYSGLSLKGGWGFAADLGVMAYQPGSAVRLGRGYYNAPGFDELARELRLSPMLQLGVSYTF